MDPFSVIRIAHIQQNESGASWLIEALWAEQAVGFIAGMPKSGKTWLAVELAVAVASGNPCLGHYRVHHPGPTLLFAAEDSADAIKERVCAIAAIRGVTDVERLAIGLINEPQLRLDDPTHQQRLAATLEKIRPRLLILDPLIRLHRCDENSSADISALLDFLRQLQRQYGVAVALVHHIRKSPSRHPGQALRGSGDLHAWFDSSLYLLHRKGRTQLHTEHRSLPSCLPVTIELKRSPHPHLCVVGEATDPTPDPADPLVERVLDVLAEQGMTRTALRECLRVRNERLGKALSLLEEEGRIYRHEGRLVVPEP